MDRPELIGLFESEVEIIIQKARKSGLNYWQIFKLLFARCLDLMMQSEVEYFVKGGR